MVFVPKTHAKNDLRVLDFLPIFVTYRHQKENIGLQKHMSKNKIFSGASRCTLQTIFGTY
jgi:hypothetical protein